MDETRTEPTWVWVVTEHDLDENASEVVTVVRDDAEAALAALWDRYYHAWSYALGRDQERDGLWYEQHADALTLRGDDEAELTLGDLTWTAQRFPVEG